jgi:plasmid stabilization system protein ParE
MREHPDARDELREAAHWYDDREPGLGDDFYDAVDDAIDRIQRWPESAPEFPAWEGTPVVRSMPVVAFPYRVLYYLTNSTAVILAYTHERRGPGYWQSRLER